MLYEEMQTNILRFFAKDWSRTISLDMETHIPDRSGFLKNERILSISLARRNSGQLTSSQGIETKTILLEIDSDEGEMKLLQSFDDLLNQIRPLCITGYGIRQYDIPLLCIKKQHYGQLMWKLIDLCESAVHIDLYHLLKYRRYKKLIDALNSPEFSHLPLKKTKSLMLFDRNGKGEAIYHLWQKDKEHLREYSEGEVFDMLLIAEEIVNK